MNDILGELRRLNFAELLKVDYPDIASYSFNKYRDNGLEHYPIRAYCTACEHAGISTATDDPHFCLTNISHGAHSSDFFRASTPCPDITQWHQEPVVFIYETPSLDYGIYKEVLFDGCRKRPSKEWYWIHDEQTPVTFPHAFKGGEYGGFVLSAITTFRLANVYMTNLVKCGLNNDKGQFKGIGSYNEQCVRTCFSRFLSREIEALKPRVVFAVGSTVESWVSDLLGGRYVIQQLPHPAGRRRGFRDEHYKVLYFWLVLRALHRAEIVGVVEAQELAKLFLLNFEGPSEQSLGA